MSFKDFFKRLLGTKAHPAHLPYIPTPPSHQPDASPPNQFPHNSANTNTSYMESEASIHTIAGTSVGFGTQKIVQVDSRGQAKDFSQTQSHILGSGKLVTNIELREVAGQALPGVAGVCRYCQAEAAQAFEANLISIQDAQIKSLYDTSSATRCEICDINTCSRHLQTVSDPRRSNPNGLYGLPTANTETAKKTTNYRLLTKKDVSISEKDLVDSG